LLKIKKNYNFEFLLFKNKLMKQIFKNNLCFFIPYFIILLFSIGVLFWSNKADIHIYINQKYNNFADVFFQVATFLAGGIAIPLLILPTLFVKYRYTISSIATILLSTLIVFVAKRSFNMPRPLKYFNTIYEGSFQLRLIEGLNIHGSYSFPSGHTATAFAVFTFFALITNKKYKLLKIFYIFMAIIIGYSRMYLSQHFLQDVVLGSLIGSLSAIVSFYFINKIKNEKLENSLLAVLKK